MEKDEISHPNDRKILLYTQPGFHLRIPSNLLSSANLAVPDSPFLNCSARAKDMGEGRKAGGPSGGWHQSQAICSQLPPAWEAATSPQPAPAPLTSRQRALTLSSCVLANLPNIAAWSLSTVLFYAHFPSPEACRHNCPPSMGVSLIVYTTSCCVETLCHLLGGSMVYVPWHRVGPIPEGFEEL